MTVPVEGGGDGGGGEVGTGGGGEIGRGGGEIDAAPGLTGGGEGGGGDGGGDSRGLSKVEAVHVGSMVCAWSGWRG
jgi:hypothetical protein